MMLARAHNRDTVPLTGEGILAIFPFNSKFFDVPPDAMQKCQRLRLKETIFNFDYMNRVNKTN